MFKSAILTGGAVVALAGVASAHNVLSVNEGPEGFLFPMTLNVNHGCKGAPVIGARLKIPDEIVDAKASDKPGWKVEYKMRKLDKPISQHGREVTEVIDEISWSTAGNPVPPDGWATFEFRVRLPDTPGKVLYFKNITVCTDGKTDPYVDLPKEALDINDPMFAKKAGEFMRATPGPSPLFIVRKADKKQYPWEWTPEQVRGDSPQQAAQAK
ncbi:MAG: YcnI family protein [Alphaproteobacteria bacterium]|nr:YcnI family protein [Alphaproteobacteria bacterium]